MICPSCGLENSTVAVYCQSCGTRLRNNSPVVSAGPMPALRGPYAGFLERFAAVVIDIVVVAVGTGILAAASFGLTAIPFFFFGPWLYEALMMSSQWQTTLGKHLLGIKVTTLDGRRISFARATARHFSKYISSIILCAGYIVAAFTEKKQALHDIIAETLVVRR